MNCPHCQSSSTTEREGRTVHGFRRYRCRDCGRRYNERTGTVLNRVQVPTDIMFLVVFWRLRYKLSLRDLAEMFLIRGIVFTHEATGRPSWHRCSPRVCASVGPATVLARR
jgi:putative transposase